jgi:hypothetical protein
MISRYWVNASLDIREVLPKESGHIRGSRL